MSTQHGFTCQTCHGSVSQVGHSIDQGREPWFEEPSCGATNCHGSQFAEEPGKLFRESRGHGGLFCSVCHGEPHAIVPSREARDNLQQITLQGYSGTLNKCEVCHGVVPDGPGPHGITVQQEASYLPGDANMHNGSWPPAVIGSDVTYLVNFFRGFSSNPACLIDGFYCAADVNADCNVIGSDVTRLVSYFRGQGDILYCPDHEPLWHTPAELPPVAPSGWPGCE